MLNITNKKRGFGINIGTYGPNKQVPSQRPDHNPTIGYIEPAGDRPSWIAWFTELGDLFLYTKRSTDGGVEGEPIVAKADGTTKQYVKIENQDDLFVNGKATDHIWTMEDRAEMLGIRFDCGDSGVLYVTREQAHDLAQQLEKWAAEEP